MPYKPSWIDRITRAVARLRMPFLLVYLLAWLIYVLILTLLRWNERVFPAGRLDVADIIMSATGICFIALVHYLDEWARRKLAMFRSSIIVSDEDFELLGYQLTALPARPTLVAGLVALSFGLLTFALVPRYYGFLHIGYGSASAALQLANFLFSWFAFGGLCYHAYHQLRIGSTATANLVRINLFNLAPVYTFAGLTFRTALGWLIVAYAWALSTPHLLANPVIVATILFMQVVALLTFALPLLRSHDQIVERKMRLVDEISSRIESVVNEMSKADQESGEAQLTNLRELLPTLTMAEERVQKVATWPWRPGVFNSLLTVILLPNAIWVFQVFVQGYLFRR
jgi:hypothetical protein